MTQRPTSDYYDAIIIGGGLAGLVCAIELSRAGHHVVVLEKKTYPFHKVCGEYVSHEVLKYLQSLGFDPYDYGAARITRLRVSTPSGKNFFAQLPLGGFGLSRYAMDDALRSLAEQLGAKVITGMRVTDVMQSDGLFTVETGTGARFSGLLAIGAWGKRDTLDKKLDRDFINTHTGYLGVKYHIRTDYPEDEIGLDNFPGGYCGMSKIEGDRYNLCYLYNRGKGGNYKNIPELEEAVLSQNPLLARIFRNADFLFDQPVVINEISFAPKTQVADGVLLCGDTAGLITPLCGNGMSMAIAAARLLSGIILRSRVLESTQLSTTAQTMLEREYTQAWRRQFGSRLFWGRAIQNLFGAPYVSEIALRTIHALRPAERWLIGRTHGQPLVGHSA